MTAYAMEELVRSALLLDKITNFLQSITLLFSIFTRQIYYNNFLALLYMPKYTKSVRKNNMRKNKRGRSRRGGYWFYPGPGDDEHAFTKLKNNFSSGSWKFWQKKPEEVPVASDYQPAAEDPAPAMAEETQMPEQAQAEGSLEYPSPDPQAMDNTEATMEPTPPMDQEQAQMDPSPPMDNNEASVETNPETSETSPYEGSGGRRRIRRRVTKKRKRTNTRRRTNKRRRSSKRRSR